MAGRIRKDIRAVMQRDPAARNVVEVVLLYSGFHAILLHRLAHRLYRWHLKFLARLISQISRFLTGIEIHPAAVIGGGFFIDHGSGVVIGETTEIGENVTLYQGVTLGGTGKEHGKRHPTLEDGVVVGAGAKLLGSFTVGQNSKIGAGAVVLKSVPPNCTVVGNPGQIVRKGDIRVKQGDVDLDHVHLPDPVMQRLSLLSQRIGQLERALDDIQQKNRSGQPPDID